MTDFSTRPDRRAFLAALAASPIVVAGIGAFPRALRAQASDEGLITPNVCLVAPETTEGPYYFDPELERGDITEDRDGTSLDLAVQVVDTACRPIAGARVDIWHCDAAGDYSGYANQGSDRRNDTRGQTFLRGHQPAGAEGVARFRTIYPGWYRGRTTHIHYKVILNDRSVLTSQIFFPDALSNYLHRSVPPYVARGLQDTPNSRDGIARRAGEGAFAAVEEVAGGYTAKLVVGVDPAG